MRILFLCTDSPVLIDSIWQAGFDSGPDVIVLGTATGVFASVSDYGNTGRWFRVGLCSELPMVIRGFIVQNPNCAACLRLRSALQVMVQGVSYEAYSDTLVVATFGRGICNCTALSLAMAVSPISQASTPFPRPRRHLQSSSSARYPHRAAANRLPSPRRQRFGFLNN